MNGHQRFTRRSDPTPDVVYARRILADVSALIRDGQVGGPSDDLSPEDATRVRTMVAGWFDFISPRLRNVITPTEPARPVGGEDPAARRRRVAAAMAAAKDPDARWTDRMETT